MSETLTETDPREGYTLNTNRLAEDSLRDAHQAERIAARMVREAAARPIVQDYREAVIFAQGMASSEDEGVWAWFAQLAGLVNCPKPIIRRTVRAILEELAS